MRSDREVGPTHASVDSVSIERQICALPIVAQTGNRLIVECEAVLRRCRQAAAPRSIFMNVRQVIHNSRKANTYRVDTAACNMRFCIRSDQGKLGERRG